jgi:PKD domain./Protein of unknown function (DUF1566).
MDKIVRVSLLCWACTANAAVDTQAPVVNTSLPTGTYSSPQQLTLNINDNSDTKPRLYYTTDGSLPRTSSTLYNGQVLNISETTAADDLYLRTLAIDKSGNWVRNIFKYKIKDNTAPSVVPSLPAGTYIGTQSITLNIHDSSDAAPKIYFTTDGTTPKKITAQLYQPGTVIVAKDTPKTVDLRLRTLAIDSSNNSTRNLFDYKISGNQLPIARFSSVVSGAAAMLSASNSTDNDGQISAYYWNFGDGQNAEGKTIYHEFPSPGKYIVQLKVVDNMYAVGTTESIIEIAKQKMDAQATGKLNDTGITNCIDSTGNISACPSSLLPGQDAELGRDATHNDNSDGHAGFSFTKIDADGYPLPTDASEWSCIKDNVTGLMWEIKTSDGGLRDKNNTYSWYDPYKNSNGGFAGLIDGGSCTEPESCDSYHYVEAINKSGLCGYTDWRVPTRNEMYGIIDFGSTTNSNAGSVNIGVYKNYFPDIAASDIFMTSSTQSYSSLFYYMIGALGDIEYSTIKQNSGNNKLRLVRDGKTPPPLGEKEEPTSDNYDEEYEE